MVAPAPPDQRPQPPVARVVVVVAARLAAAPAAILLHLHLLLLGLLLAGSPLALAAEPPPPPPPAAAAASSSSSSYTLREAPAGASSSRVAATPPPAAAAADDAARREQSRRNSRASGKAAQLFATARREAAAGDLPAALESYTSLVRLAPTFAPARSNRANLLIAQHRYAEAVADYSAALDLAPLAGDAWVVYLNRGSTYLALGEVQRALDDMNAANAAGNGDTGAILSNRAACFEALGKWDIALRDYQRAVEQNANDVQPWWIRYALVLFQRDRSQEGLAILRRVANRYEVSDVHAAMAAMHFSRGEVAEAETQWSLVDRPKLFLTRSFLESERKWPPKAVQALEEFGYGRTASRQQPS
jgi:tetratricopeptide (TPR) repeat protein